MEHAKTNALRLGFEPKNKNRSKQRKKKTKQKLFNLEKCETTIDRTKDGDYSAETDLFISLRSVVKSDKSRHD